MIQRERGEGQQARRKESQVKEGDWVKATAKPYMGEGVGTRKGGTVGDIKGSEVVVR